jgi:hypothetical protein
MSSKPVFSKNRRKALMQGRRELFESILLLSGVVVGEDSNEKHSDEEDSDNINYMSQDETEFPDITMRAEQQSSQTVSNNPMCCSTNYQGCTVKHGSVVWATTCNKQGGAFIQVPMCEDSGSENNWIHRAIARELQCSSYEVKYGSEVLGFEGRRFTATKKARIGLLDIRGRRIEVDFWIAPDGFPLPGALLGRNFIERIGHPTEYFPDKPSLVGIIVEAYRSVSVTPDCLKHNVDDRKKKEQLDAERAKEMAEEKAKARDEELAQKKQSRSKQNGKAKSGSSEGSTKRRS